MPLTFFEVEGVQIAVGSPIAAAPPGIAVGVGVSDPAGPCALTMTTRNASSAATPSKAVAAKRQEGVPRVVRGLISVAGAGIFTDCSLRLRIVATTPPGDCQVML